MEIVGILFSLPGLGSVYAGNMFGLVLTFTYLPLQVLNVFLMALIIGFLTMPLTFVLYLGAGIGLAVVSVNKHNERLAMMLDAKPI